MVGGWVDDTVGCLAGGAVHVCGQLAAAVLVSGAAGAHVRRSGRPPLARPAATGACGCRGPAVAWAGWGRRRAGWVRWRTLVYGRRPGPALGAWSGVRGGLARVVGVGQSRRSAICSARWSAAVRLRPIATMTERSARRSRTSQASSGLRPRELAEPWSTSAVSGARSRSRWRWALTRQAVEQNRAGRPVGRAVIGCVQPGPAHMAAPRYRIVTNHGGWPVQAAAALPGLAVGR